MNWENKKNKDEFYENKRKYISEMHSHEKKQKEDKLNEK